MPLGPFPASGPAGLRCGRSSKTPGSLTGWRPGRRPPARRRSAACSGRWRRPAAPHQEDGERLKEEERRRVSVLLNQTRVCPPLRPRMVNGARPQGPVSGSVSLNPDQRARNKKWRGGSVGLCPCSSSGPGRRLRPRFDSRRHGTNLWKRSEHSLHVQSGLTHGSVFIIPTLSSPSFVLTAINRMMETHRDKYYANYSPTWKRFTLCPGCLKVSLLSV